MKINKSLIFYLMIFILSSALYRILPGRPYGFAPQIAMALFGGVIIKNRFWSFALPMMSMFISDALYEILYQNGLSPICGFYEGQWINYLTFASVVFVGFFMNKVNSKSVIFYSLLSSTWFFLLSNFTVYLTNSIGLLETYILGIPFYQMSIISTLLFSSLFFGSYLLVNRKKLSYEIL